MTEREPGTGPRPIADVIRDLLERIDADAEAQAGPGRPVSFFVLERGGVPQGIGGPYRAEPETDPEADLGHEFEPEVHAETDAKPETEPEAEL